MIVLFRCVRDGRIKTSARAVDIRIVQSKRGLKPIQSGQRIAGLGARGNQSAVKFCDLLLIHELAADGDDIVLRFERVDGFLSCQGLLP